MKYLVLGFMLAVLTACAGGVDPDVKCPTDPNKQLTRQEWRACNGYQDHDPGPGER